MTSTHLRLVRNIVAWVLTLAAFMLYAITAEPTVSYWDCPEYVASAFRLEPGHPPGNPVWMLTAHMFTLFASPQNAAFAVNLMSGVCSAGAIGLLFLTLFILLTRLTSFPGELDAGLGILPSMSKKRAITIFSGSALGAIIFAVSDTFWFSAVETEVYAYSAFLTALTFWLTFLWGERRNRPHALRYPVLIAYITGISIGVHQLNLLVLPAITLIIIFYHKKNLHRGVLALCMLGSLVAIAAVLFAMMPGALGMAGNFEIIAVNKMELPMHSGVIIYALLTMLLFIVAVFISSNDRCKIATIIIGVIAIFMSGLLSFGGYAIVGALLSLVIICVGIIYRKRIDMPVLNTLMYSAAFLFLGYCCYGVILIRGIANPPLNTGSPDNIFALRSYIERDQYGGASLFYGPTPYSSQLFREDISKDSLGVTQVSYNSYYRDADDCRYQPIDSCGKKRYIEMVDRGKSRYAPELNMFFPRIYASGDMALNDYKGWTGMTPENMDSVEVSYAVDSLGNAVGRLDPKSGKRTKELLPKPTYWQNLKMLGGYQVSYMYMRYLLWNFGGRQNDVYAQGEADAGNFITGFDFADRLMLEAPDKMPAEIGDKNAGNHKYWLLPLLLGCLGIAFQLKKGKTGKRQFAVVFLFFLLSGIAIVIYLNQSPGQARERDYSFVGSFYAYAIWCGIGAAYLTDLVQRGWYKGGWRRILSVIGICVNVSIPVMMAVENFPDHNRAGRWLTRELSIPVLEALPQDAILFVNGDNSTFPIWYLQEVEGIRKDVRTVNLAYLYTPWSAPQLAIPTDGGKAIKLSIPKDKLNAASLEPFEIVYLDKGVDDARDALTKLYSEPIEGKKRPTLKADKLRILPPDSPDSVVVDLRKISGGRSYIRLRQLLMLDIIASNPERPIYWHRSARVSGVLTLDTLVHQEMFSWRLGAARDTLDITTREFLKLNKLADITGDYVDPPGLSAVAQYRFTMAQTAMAQLSLNTTDGNKKALALAQLSERLFPSRVVSYTSHIDGNIRYSDAILLARIYSELGRRSGNREYTEHARELLKVEISRAKQYREYLNSLSPQYRKYTKTRTRLSSFSLDSARNELKKLSE